MQTGFQSNSQEALKYVLCDGTLLEKVKGKRLIWVYNFHVPVKFIGTVSQVSICNLQKKIVMERKDSKMGDWVVVMLAKLCEYTKTY